MSLGCWDRRRCYRRFGAKRRSPGVSGYEKERVIVPPSAGRRHWSDRGFRFRRSGFPIP
jgi:hypothetical protein